MFVAEESYPGTRLIRGLPDVVFDMFEICLILLISLALVLMGRLHGSWFVWPRLANGMFVYRCRRHGATCLWSPLRRGKAGPLALARAGGAGLLRDRWHLWARCGLAPRCLATCRLGTGTPTLSRQPAR